MQRPFCLLVWLLADRKQNRQRKNKQPLEIALYSDGHLASEALLPIHNLLPLLRLYPYYNIL